VQRAGYFEMELVKSPQPRASVILPVHNAERYLRQAVDSVLTQTFPDFEVILLDDGSTDASLRILKQYERQDARCRVISRENRGLIATLNEGLALARGEIVLRMDADDVCRPDRFALQIDYLDRHLNCVAVGGVILLTDAEGMPIVEMFKRVTHDDIDSAMLLGEAAIAHPTAAIRRTALEKVAGYDSTVPHAEDLDLFLRLAEVGQLANLPEVVLEYRQHLASVGYRFSQTQAESVRRAVERAHVRRGVRRTNCEPEWPLEKAEELWAVHQKWGWWALAGRNLKTARKHAWEAFKCRPMNAQTWRLLACVIRGH
jgi:glycosyltransferase involved in cell wall biosynthesis